MKIISSKNINAGSSNPTTTNLSEFSARGRQELMMILRAWELNGLPDNFNTNEVVPMFNKTSGNVFLTNSDYQTAMINPETRNLELWLFTPHDGHEGFLDDLIYDYMDDPDDWDDEDVEYLRDLGADV